MNKQEVLETAAQDGMPAEKMARLRVYLDSRAETRFSVQTGSGAGLVSGRHYAHYFDVRPDGQTEDAAGYTTQCYTTQWH